MNVARLGGRTRTYLVNHYGEMSDGLNAGLPTDRLLIEWDVSSERVRTLLDSGELPDGEAGLSDALEVAIPRAFQQMKQDDAAAARTWRLQVREQLTAVFADGYVVTDFRLGAADAAYRLARSTPGVDTK